MGEEVSHRRLGLLASLEGLVDQRSAGTPLVLSRMVPSRWKMRGERLIKGFVWRCLHNTAIELTLILPIMQRQHHDNLGLGQLTITRFSAVTPRTSPTFQTRWKHASVCSTLQ